MDSSDAKGTIENSKVDKYNPPKLHREEIDFSFVITNAIQGIFALSRADNTNDIEKQNKMTDALDYLALMLTSLRDETYLADLKEIRNQEKQEIKNKLLWTAISNLLCRRKLLFKQKI